MKKSKWILCCMASLLLLLSGCGEESSKKRTNPAADEYDMNDENQPDDAVYPDDDPSFGNSGYDDPLANYIDSGAVPADSEGDYKAEPEDSEPSELPIYQGTRFVSDEPSLRVYGKFDSLSVSEEELTEWIKKAYLRRGAVVDDHHNVYSYFSTALSLPEKAQRMTQDTAVYGVYGRKGELTQVDHIIIDGKVFPVYLDEFELVQYHNEYTQKNTQWLHIELLIVESFDDSGDVGSGAEFEYEMYPQDACPKCYGTGQTTDETGQTVTCPQCGGAS